MPGVFWVTVSVYGHYAISVFAQASDMHDASTDALNLVLNETLLHKRRAAASSNTGSAASLCRTVTEDACSATDRICYSHVSQTLQEGIPDYPSYNSFEKIQAHFNSKKKWFCPQPCPPCEVTVYSVTYAKLFTSTLGVCVADGAGGSLRSSATFNPDRWGCGTNYYVWFHHYDNPHCNSMFDEPLSWTVFTDGDTSYVCYNMTGHKLQGGCRGTEQQVR